MSEFTCLHCKQTFIKINNNSCNELKAPDILCDDCNEDFKKWFSNLNYEQKKKMREDFYK